MIPSFTEELPAGFSPDSRVWIYQADRSFTAQESAVVKGMLDRFIHSWRTHGAVVNGFSQLFFDRFVVLVADETAATVSGCSTDSSVQVIREIEKQCGVGLFNRQELAFVIQNEIEIVPLSKLKEAVVEGRLSGETLFFNNTITTLAAMRAEWILPAGKSWLQHRPALAAVLQ